MTLLEVRRENLERLDRIAFIVEDHVGGIEVYSHVGAVEFFQKTQQRSGAFLSRFKTQFDCLGGEYIGNQPNAAEQFCKGRIVFIVREKAGMECDQPQLE